MFRNSQPLQKFLNINHPPALTPRESQQLLNRLSSSFRKNLDAAHGFQLEAEGRPSKSSQHGGSKSGFKPPEQRKRRSSLDSGFRPTDQHLQSILTNPLFNISRADTSIQNKPKKDPMVVFEHAVSMGMMTLTSATHCLVQQKRIVVQSPATSIQQGMQDSGAGLKVVKWLTSSGLANTNNFLKDKQFSKILMQFIVAENIQHVAWIWIKRAIRESRGISEHSRVKPSDFSNPLMCLVWAEIQGSGTLDNAVSCLSKAAGHVVELNDYQRSLVLGHSARYLVRQITEKHSRISKPAFESLAIFISRFSAWSKYENSLLDLFHPSRPNANLALSYLKTVSAVQKGMANRDINLGLYTAKFLFEKNKVADAEWVMNMLQTNFPEPVDEMVEDAKAEAASLEALDGLSLA
ncbi:hypothetical protein B0O99DRAFT_211301 [Bisporella sp. PMI_857]|nr:hypothetical protein B0O99DRAFT_211301 [Bisporella sp. PMI_857]